MIMIMGFLLATIGLVQQANSDTLYWCNENRLTWKDFTYDSSNARIGAAVSAAIIVKERHVDNQFVIEVHAIMLRNRSVQNDTSAALLEHEQIHFDIAELAARRIRKYISNQELTEKNFIKIGNEARTMASVFTSKTNSEFDNETHHGYLDLPQRRWKLEIFEQLRLLEEYMVNCR